MRDDVIKRMIRKMRNDDVDINHKFEDDTSVVHWAAMFNNIELIRHIHNQNGKLDSPGGKFMSTPLFFAAYNRNYDVAKFLIETGSAVQHINKNKASLLHICVANDDPLGYLLFLTKGVDPNNRDYKGRSPIDLAKSLNLRRFEVFANPATSSKSQKLFKWSVIGGFMIGFLASCGKFIIVLYIFTWSYMVNNRLLFLINKLSLLILILKCFGYRNDLAIQIIYLLELYVSLSLKSSLSRTTRVKYNLKMLDESIDEIINKRKYDESHFCYKCYTKKDKKWRHCRICGKCKPADAFHCPCMNSCVKKSSKYKLMGFLVVLNIVVLQLIQDQAFAGIFIYLFVLLCLSVVTFFYILSFR